MGLKCLRNRVSQGQVSYRHDSKSISLTVDIGNSQSVKLEDDWGWLHLLNHPSLELGNPGSIKVFPSIQKKSNLTGQSICPLPHVGKIFLFFHCLKSACSFHISLHFQEQKLCFTFFTLFSLSHMWVFSQYIKVDHLNAI